ncbi:hypothetical protein M8J77_015388 [Diaphorina citri]|nr:hypothetical protein M8J77_015388 [Diaphorina citri]
MPATYALAELGLSDSRKVCGEKSLRAPGLSDRLRPGFQPISATHTFRRSDCLTDLSGSLSVSGWYNTRPHHSQVWP